ncbi:helix-turn-helix domain-containing protein [Streptomyces sp. NPDC032472]|uniref:helix-turn-helix domain-containing protein n=1 Tax=Streptomyces sp. NPDC032472 TaxID=3155018 RepID=UPI0033E65AD1
MGLSKPIPGATPQTLRLTELLRHARVGPDGAEVAARRTERWLGRTLGGRAEVLCPATAHHTAEAAAVARGELGSAVVSEEGCHIRMVPLGDEPPFHVLVVTREHPFDGDSAALTRFSAIVLGLLLRLEGAETDRREREASLLHLRLAVLQLLMIGNVSLAQHTAAGIRPGLLEADWAWTALLEMPVEERAQVARDCEELTVGRALVVPCPTYDNHVITVVPVADVRAADGIGRALSDYVARRPRVFQGRSRLHPLAHARAAYEDARRNLVAARYVPGRRARHRNHTDPVELLAGAEAARWASDLLRPLDALPARTRDQLLSTVSLALRFTAVRTAKIMGVSRNTVRSRMERAGELLGADLDDVRVRTALHLALRLRDRPTAPGRHHPGLPALIGTDAGRDWARDVLGPLETDARNLHRTLGVWILADCSVGAAAQQLGLHPQTVREHLRSSETLLERELTAGGVDVYELALAFLALHGTQPPFAKPVSPDGVYDRAGVTVTCPATVHG